MKRKDFMGKSGFGQIGQRSPHECRAGGEQEHGERTCRGVWTAPCRTTRKAATRVNRLTTNHWRRSCPITKKDETVCYPGSSQSRSPVWPFMVKCRHATDFPPRNPQNVHAGRGRSPCPARRFVGYRPRRVRGPDGALGLGKDHAHEYSRLPRSPDQRQLPARRRRGHGDVGRPAGPPAESQDRLRVSEFQPSGPHHGRGKRGTADALRRRPACRPATPTREKLAGKSGTGIAGRPPALATLRRAAATGGHRPGAGQSSRRSSWPTSRRATSTRTPAAR